MSKRRNNNHQESNNDAVVAQASTDTVTVETATDSSVPIVEGNLAVEAAPAAEEQKLPYDPAVLASLASNKSAQIRYLASCGMKTGEIAKTLGIIYQFARNVLKRPLKTQQ